MAAETNAHAGVRGTDLPAKRNTSNSHSGAQGQHAGIAAGTNKEEEDGEREEGEEDMSLTGDLKALSNSMAGAVTSVTSYLGSFL